MFLFKNLQLFRLPKSLKISADELHQQLSKIQFSKCASNEMQSCGWASPRHNDLLVHCVNHQFLITLASEKKLLPASVIRQVTKIRAADLEEEQGFAPGRKALKDLKERVTEELLPRAFTVRKDTQVWIDPQNGWLAIDAASPTKADEVVKFLLKCVDKLPLESLRVKTSPQTAMTGWLASGEAPSGFTIDRDAELKSAGEDKATVRYVRHTLESDDVQKHIAGGKQSTKLAMTWNDRVSFILTDNLTIKRVKALDVLSEEVDSGTNDDERFDGAFVLMTGELANLLDQLTNALGGELKGEA